MILLIRVCAKTSGNSQESIVNNHQSLSLFSFVVGQMIKNNLTLFATLISVVLIIERFV